MGATMKFNFYGIKTLYKKLMIKDSLSNTRTALVQKIDERIEEIESLMRELKIEDLPDACICKE